MKLCYYFGPSKTYYDILCRKQDLRLDPTPKISTHATTFALCILFQGGVTLTLNRVCYYAIDCLIDHYQYVMHECHVQDTYYIFMCCGDDHFTLRARTRFKITFYGLSIHIPRFYMLYVLLLILINYTVFHVCPTECSCKTLTPLFNISSYRAKYS